MFKKNLEALKKQNSKLAEKLEKLSIFEIKDDFEVYQAESNDLIISYQGLALDDIYDPIRVAKTNWNMNVQSPPSKYDIILVYGMGLGYLFKRAYISCDCRIILYEPKIEILRYVLEYVDFSKEISDNRVFFTNDKTEALNYLSEKYLSDDKLTFIYPDAYAQLLTKEMAEFTNDVVEVCNVKKMDVNTIKNLSKKWAKHALSNLVNMKNARPVDWLKNSFEGKTALITAAGPSLKTNIDYIKKYRDKFILLSVNRAAPVLYQNGLEPDFVLFADVNSMETTLNTIGEQLKNTNIIADLRANSRLYEYFSQKLTYFSKNDLIAQHIQKITNNSFELLETAGTATAQAYYIAKLLGCKNIIFAGLDLAFKGDVIYADGRTATPDANNQVPLDTSKVHKKNVVQVKDLHGNMILTRDDYKLFVRQFEDIFAADATSNIYNVTDFGAFIEGMKYSSLPEIVNSLNSFDSDVKLSVNTLINNTAEKWNDLYKQISGMLKDEQQKLEPIKQKSRAILTKELELVQKISQFNEDTQLQEEFKLLSNEVSILLSEIIADAFLAQYFQSEFVNFVNINNSAKLQSTEMFVNLKNFEIKLLEEVVEICTSWIEFFNKTQG